MERYTLSKTKTFKFKIKGDVELTTIDYLSAGQIRLFDGSYLVGQILYKSGRGQVVTMEEDSHIENLNFRSKYYSHPIRIITNTNQLFGNIKKLCANCVQMVKRKTTYIAVSR